MTAGMAASRRQPQHKGCVKRPLGLDLAQNANHKLFPSFENDQGSQNCIYATFALGKVRHSACNSTNSGELSPMLCTAGNYGEDGQAIYGDPFQKQSCVSFGRLSWKMMGTGSGPPRTKIAHRNGIT